MQSEILQPQKKLEYSQLVGCIYVFNLIVGTGALTLPKAFQEAGWLLGFIVLSLLCFLSYITSTFVIEAMSISNGLQKLSKLKYTFSDNETFTAADTNDENTRTLFTYKADYGLTSEDVIHDEFSQSQDPIYPVINNVPSESYFEITDVFEMGQMAIIYFNRVGLILFYLSMCIYLYGDLAVYAAAVPTTLRDVACTYQLNFTVLENSSHALMSQLKDSDPCWLGVNISRINAYRIFLTIFVILFCPFVFFNLTKTKLIQFITVSMRWFAFGIMFVLMSVYLAKGNSYGQSKVMEFSQSPNLLGICIYSFMCHHSLPSLVTPINKKKNIYLVFFVNFFIILTFYLVLAFLSTFTFKNVQSLITLNFEPIDDGNQPPITNIAFFKYYLSLFPVFSISASFPIIGITLRNNLRNLITCGTGRKFNFWFMEKMFYPLLAIIPPIVVVYATNNITFLVGFTGSYAGTFIQYVIPICLVICARRTIHTFLQKFKAHSVDHVVTSEEQLNQPFQSPFRHILWGIIILIWSVVSIIFVTVNHFL